MTLYNEENSMNGITGIFRVKDGDPVLTEPVKQDSIGDPVNHPPHYTSDPSGVECITITRHRNFNIGNAIKYLWRAGLKNSACSIQDLEKAIWYIKDEIERLKDKK